MAGYEEASPNEVTTEAVREELNKDFSANGLSALEIQAIVAAWRRRTPDRVVASISLALTGWLIIVFIQDAA